MTILNKFLQGLEKERIFLGYWHLACGYLSFRLQSCGNSSQFVFVRQTPYLLST